MSVAPELPSGRNEAGLSRLTLGCSRVGSFNNATPMDEVRRTLRRALDLGVRTFDTANVYGQGDSEREIGRALRSRRDEAFVITKLGKQFSLKMRLLQPLKPVIKGLLPKRVSQKTVSAQRGAEISAHFDPAGYASTLEASLRRLGFDYVDGLLLHSPPLASLENPLVAAGLTALKRSGKARYVGVSCDDEAGLAAALKMETLDLLQLPIDLLHRLDGSPLAAQVEARSVMVMAREVLRLQPNLSPDAAIVAASRAPLVDSVIVGTSKQSHLEAAVAALREVDACS